MDWEKALMVLLVLSGVGILVYLVIAGVRGLMAAQAPTGTGVTESPTVDTLINQVLGI